MSSGKICSKSSPAGLSLMHYNRLIPLTPESFSWLHQMQEALQLRLSSLINSQLLTCHPCHIFVPSVQHWYVLYCIFSISFNDMYLDLVWCIPAFVPEWHHITLLLWNQHRTLNIFVCTWEKEIKSKVPSGYIKKRLVPFHQNNQGNSANTAHHTSALWREHTTLRPSWINLRYVQSVTNQNKSITWYWHIAKY